MPKYNVFVYPRFKPTDKIWELPRDRRTEIQNKIQELNNKYSKIAFEAGEEFHKLPAEEKTPIKCFEIHEKHFKANKLSYAVFRGLEAANRDEARDFAERYARYTAIDVKTVPEELKDYAELDYFDVTVMNHAESVKLDPPNQASLGDKALIATSIITSLISIAWTIYNWITRSDNNTDTANRRRKINEVK
jgi:hypothetical protein